MQQAREMSSKEMMHSIKKSSNRIYKQQGAAESKSSPRILLVKRIRAREVTLLELHIFRKESVVKNLQRIGIFVELSRTCILSQELNRFPTDQEGHIVGRGDVLRILLNFFNFAQETKAK
jgi:hypothetical protein